MSKEQVAQFVKAIAEGPDLNELASVNPDTASWIALAKKSGFEFTSSEFVDFVTEMTGETATESDAGGTGAARRANVKHIRKPKSRITREQ